MISKISVLGAGCMGHAIATEFALGGYPVSVYDEYVPMRESCLTRIGTLLDVRVEYGDITAEEAEKCLSLIKMAETLEESVSDADLVVEAVSEELGLKQRLFSQLHELCKPDAIIATNTSSLTMKDMVGHLPYERRCRILVCHYFNNASLMPLVEVSKFGETLPEVFDEVAAIYRKVGKHVIPILKDVPGMIVNRIQLAVLRETLYMIDNGITTVEDIDTALMYATGFRYMAIGILGGYDLATLDQGMYTANQIMPALSKADGIEPGTLMYRLNEEGKFGIKSHEGFYKYDPEKEADVQADFIRKLVLQRVQAKRLHGDNMENVGSWNVH